MATASISRIRIDYSDGSYDSITPLEADNMILFGLERNTTADKTGSNGAYTNAAIAAFLFYTAISNQNIDYKGNEPEVIKLLMYWSKNIQQN